MNETVECPYCKKYVEIDTVDHYEDYEEYQCPKCKKYFEVLAETEINYLVGGKANCLNGGEHEWRQQIGVPEINFRGKYLCKNCSETKTVENELATKEEWDRYLGR